MVSANTENEKCQQEKWWVIFIGISTNAKNLSKIDTVMLLSYTPAPRKNLDPSETLSRAVGIRHPLILSRLSIPIFTRRPPKEYWKQPQCEVIGGRSSIF